MAAISGANPIVASDVNNFTGELFKITPHRTPLLAAAGGLNGGVAINSTFFQFQTQDNATVSSVTPDDEGGSPNYSGRTRAAPQGSLQIFHEADILHSSLETNFLFLFFSFDKFLILNI